MATASQIQQQANAEIARHNQVQETLDNARRMTEFLTQREQARSNVARESETARTNRATESLRERELTHRYVDTAVKGATSLLKLIPGGKGK